VWGNNGLTVFLKRRLKKESKKLAAEAARSRGVLNQEVLKLNVYFDAVRYGYRI
jgi:hypothetical protein